MPSLPAYTIRRLASSDSVGSFKTGNPAFRPLKDFLKKHAWDYQQAMVAQTYVVVPNNDQPQSVVIGYVTLTCSEIDLRNAYELQDCEHANRYDSLPAIKIARLAIDSRYHGQGLGSELVGLSIAIAIDEIAPLIGCRFLVTDAKPEAVEFYQNQGFTFLDTHDNRNSPTPILFLDLNSID